MEGHNNHQDQEMAEKVVGELENENKTLKLLFEKLKQEYIDLHNSYNEQTMNWKQQLSSKTMEFDQMRKTFDNNTQQLKQLRSKLIEEYELRSRLENDIQQLEKFRELYQKSKRDKDLLKEEFDDFKFASQKELNNVKSDYDSQINILKQEIQRLKDKTNKPSKDLQEKNLLQRKVNELTLKNKKILGELDEVQKEKCNLVIEKEELLTFQNNKYNELLKNNRDQEADLNSYKLKNRTLTEQLDEAERRSDDLQKRLDMQSEKTEMKIELEKENLEEDLKRTQGKMNEMQEEHKKVVKSLESELNRTQDLELEKLDIKYKLEKEAMQNDVRKAKEKLEQLQAENKRSITANEEEKKRLQDKLLVLAGQYKKVCGMLETYKKKAKEKIAFLQNSLQEAVAMTGV